VSTHAILQRGNPKFHPQKRRPLVPHFGAISGFSLHLELGSASSSQFPAPSSPSHFIFDTRSAGLVVLVYIFGSFRAVSFAILIASRVPLIETGPKNIRDSPNSGLNIGK